MERKLNGAVIANKVDEVRKIIEDTGHITKDDLSQLLILACSGGSYETTEYLLTIEGVDINYKLEGFNALQEAAVGDHTAVLKLLLKHPNLHKSAETLSQLLVLASFQGNYKTVEYLLTFKDVDAAHKNEGFSALQAAAGKNHRSLVELLIKNPNTTKDPDELSECIVLASYQGAFETVDYLLTLEKVNVNYQRREDNRSALQAAVERNHTAIVKLLLGHSHIDKTTANLSETFILASENGNYETAKYLLSVEGVDVNYNERKTGLSALHLATKYEQKSLVELLLKQPNINVYSGKIFIKYARPQF